MHRGQERTSLRDGTGHRKGPPPHQAPPVVQIRKSACSRLYPAPSHHKHTASASGKSTAPRTCTQVHSNSGSKCGQSNTEAYPSRPSPIMVDKKKRVQISTNFTTDAESLHEEIHFKDTGGSKIIDRSDPHSTSFSTTITSNPVTIETDGVENKTKSGSANTTTIDQNPRTVGYDTSQL